MEKYQSDTASFTSLKLTGSHYDVGQELGRCMRKQIQDYLAEKDGYIKSLKQLTDSTEGRKTYEGFLDIVTAHFPLYRRELEGTADGAGVDFEKLFLLNLEPELTALYGDNSVVEVAPPGDECRHYPQSNGCTVICIRNADTNTFVLAHNEDGCPQMKQASVWLDLDITDTLDGKTVKERFLSFTKAGSMPGNMISIMGTDLMYTGNSVYQKWVNRSGIPRRFVMRAILSAKSFDDAMEIINKAPGIASGYNINLVHTASDSSGETSGGLVCSCIEIAGQPDGTLKCITPCTDFFTHTNLFHHLTVPHYQEESSIQRQIAMEAWRRRTSRRIEKSDILEILSNQDNKDFPVFRTGEKPDYLSTACVAVFDLEAMTLELFTDKPENTDPVLNINIRDFH
ncbi:hypothetical protein KP79_PYT22333 [Mizuhopecten yessoensis]|uniref:Peptidase C45 hydrolase domain-containing protein n=2 Tax=Mizuhopecten yessoensis TaxID=6573 RepID=A0A210Q7S6_MIZYE|nr:hypothetical protein KP79_PYT22333 [Mizuhopecten yessoensis]